MTVDEPLPCSILLLAGGRGQRMGGRDKGLLEWQGRPLIAHLHALTRPLTDDLIISCNRNAEHYAPYADRLVADAEEHFPGPLAGILAGLAAARHPHLLVLPCDAPQADLALIEDMRTLARHEPDKAVLIRRGEQWEPLFCLLPKTFLPPLQQAWQDGERSPRRALLSLSILALPCVEHDPRLANLNTPELLAETPPGAPS
ncbi:MULTISPECIES: molybdenum cofactor guanylyltransferase MobA [unclassified Pseudomonas]|uniref:molybdenum cofactor guanylyltransferase MobA n=1 Tax=unclassified Pseudomonas TaxID=196821 RepID=UPI0024490F45|nr:MULTISPECIES: molybdenum cofactor guanylyltransferase MobA [unclassified Pseudomonas]MDH0892746.1 molybdenum cofactor guanylyltransferase MobA [Pseudomonas sp. GD03875]MDH1063594.1 molybdenum cofactor guanylyltransferase MobA [Pseudomonas sp. GD03985]